MSLLQRNQTATWAELGRVINDARWNTRGSVQTYGKTFLKQTN